MNMEEIRKMIFNELKKIAPETEPEQLNPDHLISKSLDLDSYDWLQFIVSIGKKINFDIPEDDYIKINTLNKLFSYLHSKAV